MKVREATKKGYSLAYPYDSINIGVPNSQRRGRVGRGVVDTLTTGNDKAVVVLE